MSVAGQQAAAPGTPGGSVAVQVWLQASPRKRLVISSAEIVSPSSFKSSSDKHIGGNPPGPSWGGRREAGESAAVAVAGCLRLRFLHLCSQLPLEHCHVVDGDERVRVPIAEAHAQPLQRLAKQRLSGGEVTLGLQQHAEVADGGERARICSSEARVPKVMLVPWPLVRLAWSRAPRSSMLSASR